MTMKRERRQEGRWEWERLRRKKGRCKIQREGQTSALEFRSRPFSSSIQGTQLHFHEKEGGKRGVREGLNGAGQAGRGEKRGNG